MKKPVSIFIIPLIAVLFLSCGSTKEKSADEDFSIVTDTEEPVYDDDQTVVDNDSGEPDEDINDFDIEPDSLSFKTRPHGITRWDETYSYFIRCESEQNLKTVITVSKDDTCKGTIESDTYTFNPTKMKFPDGRCSIAVKCSDGLNKITQKTAIQIPNPFEYLPQPVDQPVVISTFWANTEQALFIEDSGLYSINSDDDIELIEEGNVNYLQSFLTFYYSTDELFYYISNEGIISTDGTVDKRKIVLPIEKISEIADMSSEFYFLISVDMEENIVFTTFNIDLSNKRTWFYSSSEDDFFILDDENNWFSSKGDSDDLIYERKEGEYFILNKEEKKLVEICHDETGKRPFAKSYINGRIFYQYDNDNCLTYLDISTCQEEKICGCDSGGISILRQLNKSFFHIVNHCENNTLITFYSSGEPEITAGFDEIISQPYSSDGIHLFAIMPPENSDKSYKCLRTLNIESGTMKSVEMMCNPGESYEFAGFSGEEALFNVFGKSPEHKLYSVDNDGSFSERYPDMKSTPQKMSIYPVKKIGTGKDRIYINAGRYTQCFETDGNPEDIKFLAKSTGNIYSVNDNTIMSSYKSGDYTYLNSFNIANGEKTIVAAGQDCKRSDIGFDGFYYYGISANGMSLFGITSAENCGSYFLWTTDGTPAGTINHEILIEPGMISPDSSGGFYYGSSHYIENSQKKATATGASGTVLGFIGDTLIVYDKEEDYISKITAMQKGKIIGSFLNETSRKLSGITISGSALQLLETTDEAEPETYLISFPDGDLSAEPLSALLFDNSFTNVSKVGVNDKKSIFSAEVKGAAGKAVKSVLLNEEGITVSDPLYYFSKDSSFSGMVILNDRFLFSEDGTLLSIPLYEYCYSPFLMFEQTGNFKYIGESFSKEPVIEHNSNDSDSDSFLIVTDGKSTKSLNKGSWYSDFSIWNGMILESGKRFIIDKDSESLENLEIVSKNAGSDIYATKSFQNIFYRVCDESDTHCDNPYYFIYHLPETE